MRPSRKAAVLLTASAIVAGAAEFRGSVSAGPQPVSRTRQQTPMQRGVALLEAGEVEAAIETLQQIVAVRPGFPPARYYLGRALNAAGRFDEALEHLRTGLRDAADPAAFHLAIAQALFELDRLAEARIALDAAGALRPDLSAVPFRVAQICFRAGNVEAAIDELDRATSLAPQWLDPPLRAAEIEGTYGDPARAARHLSRAVEIQPGDPGLWVRYADALAAIADDPGAESAYRNAIEIDADSPLAYLALGYFLFNGQRFEEAREPLEDVLVRFPDDPQVLIPMADIEMIMGNHEAALELVDAALTSIGAAPQPALIAADATPRPAATSPGVPLNNPLRGNALQVRARVLIGLNRLAEAEATARSLLDLDPSNLDGLFVLGTALVRSGNVRGREQLARFQRLSDAREHRELGIDLFRFAGDLAGATTELERAIAIDPEDTEALVGLGAIERTRGDPDAAIDTLAEARRLGADGPEWYREWVLALHAVGRTEEARQASIEAQGRGASLGPLVWAALNNHPGAC